MKALDLVLVLGICTAPCVVLAHSNNTHGNNPRTLVVVVGEEFLVSSNVASYLDAVGLAEVSSGNCSNAFQMCAQENYGVWSNHTHWCIDTYLCAYETCIEECDGDAQDICISNSQYDFLNCSGLDLMSLGDEWGTSHDVTIELLLGDL